MSVKVFLKAYMLGLVSSASIYMDLHFFLVLIHIAGTILGVGGATLAEVLYIAALRDGKVDASEKLMMHSNYTMIRVGTLLVLISGFALVYWWVLVEGSTWPLESGKVWAKDTLVVIILINAVLLSRHLMPLWLGASLSFTSWWVATILGSWHEIPYTYIQIMLGYIVAVFVVALVLELIRRFYAKKK